MSLRPSIPHYQYRGHRLVTPPSVEPVSAAEFRTFVKADAGIVSDAEALLYIQQAREFLENMTGLAFINQTWRLSLDCWPGYFESWWDGVREVAVTELTSGRPRDLELPRYPLSSVTTVKTYDEASNETTVIVADYFDVDLERRPGRLGLKFGQIWPLATRPTNAIQITYVAGFGASASDVPAGIRGAVLALAGYYYEHRGECDMQMAAAKSGAADTMEMYRVRQI